MSRTLPISDLFFLRETIQDTVRGIDAGDKEAVALARGIAKKLLATNDGYVKLCLLLVAVDVERRIEERTGRE